MQDRLPLVFGVTGHRDLEGQDKKKLKEIVFEHLNDLHERFENTPFLLISSLAEGADQLVVEAVFDLRDKLNDKLDVELIVPLPMPESEYLATFSTLEGKSKYHELAKKALRKAHIPEFTILDEEPLPKDVHAKDIQFLLTGAYVARNCHVLIALWDGKPEKGVGGTASIVSFKRTGKLRDLTPNYTSALENVHEVFGTGFDPLEIREVGPVDWIELPLHPDKEPAVERLALRATIRTIANRRWRASST